MTAAEKVRNIRGQKTARDKARSEGKCIACRVEDKSPDSKSSCEACLEAARQRKKTARAAERAEAPRVPMATGSAPKEFVPALDGRLARPAADERCHCGKPVAVKGALFCVGDGKQYVADMLRRTSK